MRSKEIGKTQVVGAGRYWGAAQLLDTIVTLEKLMHLSEN
jgi:hypothetical protein